MTAQLPLPMPPTPGAVDIGAVVALVEDTDGGRVFLRGELVYAWSGDDVALRRLAAVQLVEINAATRVPMSRPGSGSMRPRCGAGARTCRR